MKYRITLYEYWNFGAKKGSGKDADIKVLKDEENDMPFYAAKTLNGLLRENMLKFDKNNVPTYYGVEGLENEGKVSIHSAKLPKALEGEIIKYGLQYKLYKEIPSTAISEQGTAKDKSLRTTEMTVPMIIEGEINPNGCDIEPIVRAMGMIKKLGYKKNRGFGRCDVILLDDKGGEIRWQPNT